MSQVNRLIATLPTDVQQRLLARGQRVRVPARTTLCDMGEPCEHAYFPDSGLASLLATTEDGATVEVATVGADGLIGLPLLTDSIAAPHTIVVRLPMEAVRLPARAFVGELTQAPILRQTLNQYVHSVVAQTAQIALCTRFHSARQRLCRWLLTARDHSQADLIEITQDALAQTLGLSRTGVTAIAVDLQDRGLMRCRHGRITLLDHRGLEVLACECYRILRDECLAPAAASR
jgi:CRP-like cAMP-binding protein